MEISELVAELEKHQSSSYGWALSCCGRSGAEAEDVLQTSYLKILEGKARYRGEASFKTWLFAVIRKTAASERRKNVLRRLKLPGMRSQHDCVPSSQEPDVAWELSERQLFFRRALRSLPARQQEALHLVFYQDLSLREAALVMGVSIGAARTHYQRGKKRLRKLLGESERIHGVEWRRENNPSAIS
jgi:RNA polymerase sigma factor (sigma-70 family)